MATSVPDSSLRHGIASETDGATFRAVLITRGRKTGNTHAVQLKAVSHSGRIYLSRHRPDGDWYLNAVANPDVIVEYGKGTGKKRISGMARAVTDKRLLQRISDIKYPGEERAKEYRVAIEVTPNDDAPDRQGTPH